MATQYDKAVAFKALHDNRDSFIIPNPWDQGSARSLQELGFKALATTSAGFAQTLGRRDGQVSVEEKIEHCRALCEVTDIPISADFENGFGDDPETVAETVRLAAEAGLAGVSIEDIALPAPESYPFDLALARIEAAIDAAGAAGIVLTARADGCHTKSYDQAEALRRCQAFAQAGADVIYAPRVDADTTRSMVATGTPVNLLVAGPVGNLTADQIGALGVARISIGARLARVTQQVILDGTRAMLERGDFTMLNGGANVAEVEALLTK